MSSSAASQPLPYRDDPGDDERNDARSDEEFAPLIDTESYQPADAAANSKTALKAIRILTALTLCFSVLAVMLLIANKILVHTQHYDHWNGGGYEFYWPTRRGSRAVGVTAVFSIIISIYNIVTFCYHLPTAPFLINFLFDVLVGSLVIGYAATGLSEIGETYCWGRYREGRWSVDRGGCWSHSLPSRILIGIALLFGIIYGALHLALFAIRYHVLLKSRRVSKRSWLKWNLPTGQLKFEASLKLLKEPERSSGSEEQGA